MIERMVFMAIIFLALDIYVFKAVYPFLNADDRLLKFSLIAGYWLINIGFMVFLFYGMSTFRQTKAESSIAMYALGAYFVIFIPKVLIGSFHLFDDVFNLFTWGFSKMSSGETDWARRNFITKLGLGLGAVMFGGALYGVTKGKYAWRVLENTVRSSRLPKEFDGFKIVQLSDAHLGSFVRNYEPVERMVDMVNELKPDIILFTGDMVNEHAQEAEGWEFVFEKLKAKHGKFSVFGNHDYGNYGPWDDKEAANSVELLKKVKRKMGFQILEDENVSLSKDGAELKLLGVHNWGRSKHFPKKGNLPKAMNGTKTEDFKILMSHDPTHFEDMIMGKETIDLTLSGHTHGMQMGIEIPALGIKYSPVKHIYKRWAGLYQEGEQFLHVNRGMGVLAFPGRIGMAPEISLITLKSA
jgi:predicted MPP superfamily phosphohydrolase